METLNPDEFAHVEFKFNKPKKKKSPPQEDTSGGIIFKIFFTLFWIVGIIAIFLNVIQKNAIGN